MTVLVLVSLLTLQICFGQQQQLLTQQQQLQPAQPQLYPQTPQTGAGQPANMVDLFRVAANSLSQTLINLLNYKAQWLNQLASSIPPAQTNPTQGTLQSAPVLPTLPNFQSSAPAGNLPSTGLPDPTSQQSAAPFQSTQLQNANPPPALQQTPQGPSATGVNPLPNPPQAALPAAQGTTLPGANPIATPPQAPQPASQ